MSVGSITSANCDCGVRFIEMENVRRRHLSQRRAHTFGMANICQNSKSKTISFSWGQTKFSIGTNRMTVMLILNSIDLLTKMQDSLQGKGSTNRSIALKLFHTEASLKAEVRKPSRKPSPSSCDAHVILHLTPPNKKEKHCQRHNGPRVLTL